MTETPMGSGLPPQARPAAAAESQATIPAVPAGISLLAASSRRTHQAAASRIPDFFPPTRHMPFASALGIRAVDPAAARPQAHGGVIRAVDPAAARRPAHGGVLAHFTPLEASRAY